MEDLEEHALTNARDSPNAGNDTLMTPSSYNHIREKFNEFLKWKSIDQKY